MKMVSGLILFAGCFVNLFAQENESARMRPTTNIQNENENRFYNIQCYECNYLGIVNSFEYGSYFIGAEFKHYENKIIGGSYYGSFRRSLTRLKDESELNAISIGYNLAILGLETQVYFNQTHFAWYLTPKFGYDWGAFSLFYG